MKVSLKWLEELVDINVSHEELARLFSLRSAEVDSLYKLAPATNLVVGEILECVEHPDSDHLHITTVNVGKEVLTIVCGAPNVKKGQKIIVALDGAKLPGGTIKKSMLRGIESNGMNCSLEELGLDKKFQKYEGIYILDDDAKVGEDALKYLNIDTDVLDIELTPNRADLLSMLGVAYDTKAILNTNMHVKDLEPKCSNALHDIEVSTDTDKCMSYYSKVIRDVKIKESPEWLKGVLMAQDIRPINNVVDITNYVMMYYGQPLHAFDYDQIKTKKVVVKLANDNDKFVTLDGIERTLTSNDIVITDGEKPICLGGVMGGLNSEVEDNTVNIFLESATFNPLNIRKTSRRLDLRSEASTRYERGVDPNRTIKALNMACKLFEELASGKVSKEIHYFENNDLNDKEIDITLDKINSVVGKEYKVKEIEDVFNRLSLNYSYKDGLFKVMAPTRRGDLNTYQDLIEEIVRISGFENVPTKLNPNTEVGKLTKEALFERKVRHTLLDLGLDEVITYSLVSEKEATAFDFEEKELIKPLMPLNIDRSVMRHSITPSLISVLNYNLARQAESGLYFEIGNVYYGRSERLHLSGLMYNEYSSTKWKGQKEIVDFFLVKGILTNLFNKLSVINVRYEVNDKIKNLHPGISALIYSNNVYLGYIGKLHPLYAKSSDTVESFVFELDMQNLFEQAHRQSKMNEIPKYPFVSRDIALVMPKELLVKDVLAEIKKAGVKELTQVNIFDLYEGEKLGENQKQIAFKLVFQSQAKTLESQDVDGFVNKILDNLEKKLGITLRK